MFDLTVTDADRVDIGMIDRYGFEIEFGSDNNDFDLTLPIDSEIALGRGCLVYSDGTDYGGMITAVRVDTESSSVVYKGKTWHGMLDMHVIEPPEGQSYFSFEGDANLALAEIVEALGIEDIFSASSDPCGVNVAWQIRYETAYSAVASRLSDDRLKLRVQWNGERAVLSAEPSVNHEVDSDQIQFTVEKDYLPCNHLVCLGKGEMADRTVIHVFADADGEVSQMQTLTGVLEHAQIYELSNSEDDDLLSDGLEKLKEMQVAASIETGSELSADFDVGDTVSATENVIGVTATARVNKKSVSAENGKASISVEIGDAAISSIGRGGGVK